MSGNATTRKNEIMKCEKCNLLVIQSVFVQSLCPKCKVAHLDEQQRNHQRSAQIGKEVGDLLEIEQY